MRIAIVGGSGFIGSTVADALTGHASVCLVKAPRISSGSLMRSWASQGSQFVSALAEELEDCEVVINAAGIADATEIDHEKLLGANAFLPRIIAKACVEAQVTRFVHVSSAAVQGRRRLSEDADVDPSTRYAASKAAGEAGLLKSEFAGLTIYRPTSVHGVNRAISHSLLRIAGTPLSFVAGDGDRPTPQVPVERVGEAVRLLALSETQPPQIVLHPWEGVRTGPFLEYLGGIAPRHLSDSAARRTVRAGYQASNVLPALAPHARRLELLLFGQAQELGWLEGRLSQATPPEVWLTKLRRQIRDAHRTTPRRAKDPL